MRPAARYRVVFYTDATRLGGAEISLGNLVGELPDGIDAVVAGTDAAVVEAVAGRRHGVATAVLPPVRDKFDRTAIAAHFALFRRWRPQICHVNLRTPYSCQYGLAAALLSPGTRVVAVEHLPLHSSSPLSRWFKRRTSAALAAHIAVGARAAREIEEDAGLPPGSIRVVRNGVPAPAGEPVARPAAGPIVGSVGRLERRKGYDLLVDALGELSGVTAVVVGSGPEESALRERAAAAGVEDRLLLPGWSADPRAYLPRFDVFVLPSRSEAFPLVVLEAMLAARPVVAADVGSVGEAVVDGRTGILVPPGDAHALAEAVGSLLRDPTRAAALGEAGRRRAEAEFSAAAMARSYVLLYEELLRGRPATTSS